MRDSAWAAAFSGGWRRSRGGASTLQVGTPPSSRCRGLRPPMPWDRQRGGEGVWDRLLFFRKGIAIIALSPGVAALASSG